jgi:hypothetical protein
MRHKRSQGCALRPDQDAAADRGFDRRCGTRGKTVACKVQESSGISNGTSALGVAVGLGEIDMPRADQILPRSGSLFLGRLVLFRHGIFAGADRVARQPKTAPVGIFASATR